MLHFMRAPLIAAGASALVLLTQAQAASTGGATDAANPLAGVAQLVVPDALILPSERKVVVRIQLKQAVNRMISVRWHLENAKVAYAPRFFDDAQGGNLFFMPGEVEKLVTVATKEPLQGGTIKVVAIAANDPPVSSSAGEIREVGSRPPPAPYRANRTPPQPALTAGRKLVFETNFLDAISPDAKPKTWRSRPYWGRVQCSNQELGPYADKATDPGTNPHPIVGGMRVLRVEAVKVRDKACAPGQPEQFPFAASMIDGINKFSFKYGYAELVVKIGPVTPGTTPAYWFAPAAGGWPPEIDVFEAGLGGNPNLASTIHGKEYGAEGVDLKIIPDDQFHTIGFDWTPQWMTTLYDGKVVAYHVNTVNEAMTPIFNIATFGLGNPPPKLPMPAGWKGEMTLKSWKVWQ
jgi:hypothetical protein